jgi:hypothetical protein
MYKKAGLKYINVYKALISLLLLFFLPLLSNAQGGPTPPGPGGIPIDGGIIFLIVGIVATGGGRLLYIYKKKFNKKDN